MKEDGNVSRRIDQMLLLLGRRPKLPLSVSCADPREVGVVAALTLLLLLA